MLAKALRWKKSRGGVYHAAPNFTIYPPGTLHPDRFVACKGENFHAAHATLELAQADCQHFADVRVIRLLSSESRRMVREHLANTPAASPAEYARRARIAGELDRLEQPEGETA